jgi:hypothetical protein
VTDFYVGTVGGNGELARHRGDVRWQLALVPRLSGGVAVWHQFVYRHEQSRHPDAGTRQIVVCIYNSLKTLGRNRGCSPKGVPPGWLQFASQWVWQPHVVDGSISEGRRRRGRGEGSSAGLDDAGPQARRVEQRSTTTHEATDAAGCNAALRHVEHAVHVAQAVLKPRVLSCHPPDPQ